MSSLPAAIYLAMLLTIKMNSAPTFNARILVSINRRGGLEASSKLYKANRAADKLNTLHASAWVMTHPAVVNMPVHGGGKTDRFMNTGTSKHLTEFPADMCHCFCLCELTLFVQGLPRCWQSTASAPRPLPLTPVTGVRPRQVAWPLPQIEIKGLFLHCLPHTQPAHPETYIFPVNVLNIQAYVMVFYRLTEAKGPRAQRRATPTGVSGY